MDTTSPSAWFPDASYATILGSRFRSSISRCRTPSVSCSTGERGDETAMGRRSGGRKQSMGTPICTTMSTTCQMAESPEADHAGSHPATMVCR